MYIILECICCYLCSCTNDAKVVCIRSDPPNNIMLVKSQTSSHVTTIVYEGEIPHYY